MFYERFKAMCLAVGKSPNAVAKEIGVSSGAISEWKKGRMPRTDTLQKIADYFNVSFLDLVPPETNITIRMGKNSTTFRWSGNKKEEKVGEISEELPTRMVPVYESVSAGFGSLARNEVVSYVPCVIHSITEAQETIGIKVHGDSMYPKIEDGDTIIVHKQTSVDSGTIAVVMVDGDEGLVKRVEYGADWIHLISINPMYPIMKFKGEDVLRVQVVGRVTRIIKDV